MHVCVCVLWVCVLSRCVCARCVFLRALHVFCGLVYVPLAAHVCVCLSPLTLCLFPCICIHMLCLCARMCLYVCECLPIVLFSSPHTSACYCITSLLASVILRLQHSFARLEPPCPALSSLPSTADTYASRTGPDISDFQDERVCKNYLCGCCPNELFLNTVGPAVTTTRHHRRIVGIFLVRSAPVASTLLDSD